MTAKWYRKAKGKSKKKKKKHLQKPNTTCNSHSAIISAQRCSSKILSETASSSLLLTQDSPDIPTEFWCPGCPTDRIQESRRVVQPGTACCSHELGTSCATSAALPQNQALVASQGSLPSRGEEGDTGGVWQRLMPFLHTLLVTRAREGAVGNLQTDCLIWKTHPSLTVAAGAWN